MGIPGLFREITKKYPSIHHPLSIESIKNIKSKKTLFIDFNSFIYNAIGLCQAPITNNDVINNTINILNDIVGIVDASLIYIAIDGPAPCSKIIQQRNRRFKRLLDNKVSTMFDQEQSQWNTCQITPGTLFMQDLSNAVRTWSNKQSTHIIISDQCVPGEGEQKILEWMRNNPNALGDHVYVYSNDGDFLILLSQVFSKNRQCKLIADVSKSSNDAISEYKTTYYTIDVSIYCECIINCIRESCRQELQVSDISLLHDFMFFMSLCGNDFVKPVPYLRCRERGSMEFMIGIYGRLLNRHKGNLVVVLKTKFILNDAFFIDMIGEVAKYEKNKTNVQVQRVNDGLQKGSRDRGNGIDQVHHLAFYSKHHPFHHAYHNQYKYLYNPKDNHYTHKNKYYNMFLETRRMKCHMMINYIESILWTFQYYMFGASSWSWFYAYPVAPMPSDVVAFLKESKHPSIIRLLPSDRSKPLKPFVQLALVLPREYHALLPTEISKALGGKGWDWFYPSSDDMWLHGLDEHKYIYSEPKIAHWHRGTIGSINRLCRMCKHKRNRLSWRIYTNNYGRDITKHR